jgi:uncharacterized protein YcfJ
VGFVQSGGIQDSPPTIPEVTMKRIFTTVVLAGALALAGCEDTASNNQIAGALIGGTIGGLTATALNADQSWVIVGTLAGAVAGSMIARNAERGTCAYARGDGTYYEAPCP